MPSFAHVSLILAPDRSKLSKRHGATSVGQVVNDCYILFVSLVKIGVKFFVSSSDFLIHMFSFFFLFLVDKGSSKERIEVSTSNIYVLTVQGDGVPASGNGELPCTARLG